MKPFCLRAFSLLMVITLALSALIVPPAAAQDDSKISRLGEYRGYTSPEYQEWRRTSQYVTVRDGTRIAVDVILPFKADLPAETTFPVIYVHERYGRARLVNDAPITLASYLPLWSFWVSHGYALVVSDVRGGGVSFGCRTAELSDQDSRDAYDLIDWIVSQPWSSGKVGMAGVSANANVQWLAAGSGHPALKAIIPQMTMFDLYSFVYPGGVYRYEFLEAWADNVNRTDIRAPRVPVDEDTDGALAASALAQHQCNINVATGSRAHPFRDSLWTETNEYAYQAWSLFRMAAPINAANTVAVYQIAGWFDMWPREQAAWFNNLTVPQRIVFTPYSHEAGFSPEWQKFIDPLVNDPFNDLTAANFQMIEHLRFFDYHLKGIQNGIMDEAPVWYYLMGAPAGEGWRSATQFPLPNQRLTDFYLDGGDSGSIKSLNDGLLSQTLTEAGIDRELLITAATTGGSTRWHNGHGGEFYYPDMSAQGEISLTYTTPPLTESLEVTGFPVVHLWVAVDSGDADFFVYLEEVDPDGYAHYITEGVLRASHRRLSDPPYQYMNLPYQRSYETDVESIPSGEIQELVIDLQPTSNIFDAGHRIRVRITNSDLGSYTSLQPNPAPLFSIYRSASDPSRIVLPVIPKP
ncbi:MAG: CocE/NonD family hydrolase [Anaerolinea sp.]|nr:CocE/NonD family hydrolase [Anaerolinea sp.]